MAALIKGITVTLIDKTEVGRDGFGAPIWEEKRIRVDNVLVSPNQGTDGGVISEVSLHGKTAQYVLAIPKEDRNNWEDREVEFFGCRWKTVGFSTVGIDHLIPLDWNRKVTVERFG